MSFRRIALINPPIDEDRIRCIDAGHWQPLNLLALASHIKHSDYECDIVIYDQEIMSKDEIYHSLANFQPDLVGISPNIDSYQQTIHIAKLCKAINAKVVLGGNYASSLGSRILFNRKEIDYIIKRDGEIPFLELIKGKSLANIKNVIYRQGNNIFENDLAYNNSATISEIDYSLVDLEKYFNNYALNRNKGPFNRPLAFLSQRGCVWKDKTGGCTFCSRELISRFDNTKQVWNRIRKLKEQFSIDAIMDVGDDFLGNLDWFTSFYENKTNFNDEFGIRFIYSRVNHINDTTVKMLKDLNTFEIFLGIESGDQSILKNTIKGNTIDQQKRAIKLLEKNNINVALGFVLGLPGENRKTLEATSNYIESLLNHTNITEVVVSIMTPLPGSPSYDLMLDHNKLGHKYLNSDMYDLIDLQKDWVNNFCDVSFDEIIHISHKLNQLKDNVTVEFDYA
ncbi:radical SAM protein [Spirosoma terrae]|uniref:Radical SAM protein n=1 Tax=Spirosoma terrae TaxID=1968276 RepID=A0A6L9L9I4_9BACT|nr:radical SAM protein [Spirosoma terrae]NDU97226.1 radical SAM protein [Spirosoma terrae]